MCVEDQERQLQEVELLRQVLQDLSEVFPVARQSLRLRLREVSTAKRMCFVAPCTMEALSQTVKRLSDELPAPW